jgi:hypothetical protein
MLEAELLLREDALLLELDERLREEELLFLEAELFFLEAALLDLEELFLLDEEDFFLDADDLLLEEELFFLEEELLDLLLDGELLFLEEELLLLLLLLELRLAAIVFHQFFISFSNFHCIFGFTIGPNRVERDLCPPPIPKKRFPASEMPVYRGRERDFVQNVFATFHFGHIRIHPRKELKALP